MSDEKADLCCSCGEQLGEPATQCYIKFRYQIPGTEAANVLVAVVCPTCAADAENPAKFPVVESMINAKIIRIENDSLIFTPENRKDEM